VCHVSNGVAIVSVVDNGVLGQGVPVSNWVQVYSDEANCTCVPNDSWDEITQCAFYGNSYSYVTPVHADISSIIIDGESYFVYRFSGIPESNYGYILRRNGVPLNLTGDYVTASGNFWIMVVKLTNNPVFNNVNFSYAKIVNGSYGGVVTGYYHCKPAVGGSPPCYPTPYTSGVQGGLEAWINFHFQPAPATTCTTPAFSNQVLGNVSSADFSGVNIGIAAGQKDFSLQFNNCPSNMQRILYKVEAASGASPNPVEGLLPLRPPPQSTASGVAVQVLENNTGSGNAYSPSSLGTWKTLTRYDQDKTLVDYELPMRVRYYQTEATIIPGSVEAAMTITIQYQ